MGQRNSRNVRNCKILLKYFTVARPCPRTGIRMALGNTYSQELL